MTAPASTSAGGMRVVLPAPGEAHNTTALRRARASRTSAMCPSTISGSNGLTWLRDAEAASFEQCLDIRIAPAEAPVGLGSIDRIAVREDMGAKTLVRAGIPRAARLDEREPG